MAKCALAVHVDVQACAYRAPVIDQSERPEHSVLTDQRASMLRSHAFGERPTTSLNARKKPGWLA